MQNPLTTPEWWNTLAVLNRTAAKACQRSAPTAAEAFNKSAAYADSVSATLVRKRMEQQVQRSD